MAGTTPNLALYLPGGGSTGTYTPDEVADIDPLNQNFLKIDTFAGQVGVQTSQNKQFYGPAAAISGISGQKLGDEYQESDANKYLWRYDGSNWVLEQPGSFVVRPTSVLAAGGTGSINPDGTVDFSGVTNIGINGCFSTKYREYEVSWSVIRTATQTEAFRLRAAGVDAVGASSYTHRRYYNADAGGILQVTNNIQQWEFGCGHTAPACSMYKTIRLQNVAVADYTRIVSGVGGEADGSTNVATLVAMFGEHRVPTAYDGFILFTISGTLSGKIRITGFR